MFPVDPVLVFSDAAGLKEASSTITKEEIQFIFKIRNRGIKVKMNLKGLYDSYMNVKYVKMRKIHRNIFMNAKKFGK